MKVALINPNLSGDVSCYDVGLTYLATYINERTKHKAQIIDYTFHRRHWKKHLLKKLEEINPDIIGITTVTLYIKYIKDTIKEIRKKYKVPIILGGYHATLNAKEAINLKGVDAICIGNGEYAFEEYLHALENKKPLRGITGIWYKKNGEIIKNELRPLIQDVDSLPIPNYDLWEDIDKYFYFLGQGYFIGIRGCPFNCTYCSEKSMKKIFPKQYIRYRDPKEFAREIEQQYNKYKDRGMRIAHCFDPVFTFNKEWLKRFTDEYIRLGMDKKLPLSVFTEASVTDEDRVKWLARANCKILRIGIEAGDEHIRMDIYEKKVTDEQIRNAVRLCKKYGIAITGYNMLGGPGESKKTVQKTLDFVDELKIERPIFFIYRPLKGTDALKKIEELGNKIDESKMSDEIDSLHFGAALETCDLKQKDTERYQRKAFLKYHGGRVFSLIKKQKLTFFKNLIIYSLNGFRYGVGYRYIAGYFLVCAGDNLYS